MRILLIAFVVMFSQVLFAANDCFNQRQVRSFKVLDDRTVEIDTGRRDYIVKVDFCRELRWSRRIAFDSFSSMRVCRGDRLLVLDNFYDHVIESCRIRHVELIK